MDDHRKEDDSRIKKSMTRLGNFQAKEDKGLRQDSALGMAIKGRRKNIPDTRQGQWLG